MTSFKEALAVAENKVNTPTFKTTLANMAFNPAFSAAAGTANMGGTVQRLSNMFEMTKTPVNLEEFMCTTKFNERGNVFSPVMESEFDDREFKLVSNLEVKSGFTKNILKDPEKEYTNKLECDAIEEDEDESQLDRVSSENSQVSPKKMPKVQDQIQATEIFPQPSRDEH